MATEEATTAAEEATAAASGKGKEIADEASEHEAFMFQNLVGEKLSKAEIEEHKSQYFYALFFIYPYYKIKKLPITSNFKITLFDFY